MGAEQGQTLPSVNLTSDGPTTESAGMGAKVVVWCRGCTLRPPSYPLPLPNTPAMTPALVHPYPNEEGTVSVAGSYFQPPQKWLESTLGYSGWWWGGGVSHWGVCPAPSRTGRDPGRRLYGRSGACNPCTLHPSAGPHSSINGLCTPPYGPTPNRQRLQYRQCHTGITTWAVSPLIWHASAIACGDRGRGHAGRQMRCIRFGLL